MSTDEAAALVAALHRIEKKLDTLIAALAQDEEEDGVPLVSLDGGNVFKPRDHGRGLG